MPGKRNTSGRPQPGPKRRKGPTSTEAVGSLPVRQVEDELVPVLKEQQVVIIVAETGSGKTTQVYMELPSSDVSSFSSALTVKCPAGAPDPAGSGV